MSDGANKLTQRELFKQFLAYPKSQRKHLFLDGEDEDAEPITTEAQFCQVHGISVPAVALWKKDPLFLKGVRELRESYLAQSLPDVLDSLRQEAESGSTAAIKLYLQYLNEYRDTRTVHTVNEGMAGGDNPFASMDFIIYFALELAKRLVKLDALDISAEDLSNKIVPIVKEFAAPHVEAE